MSEKKLVHYEGKLGRFDYDPNMYRVVSEGFVGKQRQHLHFNDDYVGPISLPEGCIDAHLMFYGCDIKKGCYLDNFDTAQIIRMDNMFASAVLPEGFTLGDKFDTSNVYDMGGMFWRTVLPNDFTLGDNFDTSSVQYMNQMFYGVDFPDGFILGDKFDTSNVCHMDGMFEDAVLPDNFTLGDKFDISNLGHMSDVFTNTRIPKGVDLSEIIRINNGNKYVCNPSRFIQVIDSPSFDDVGDKGHGGLGE